MVTPVTNDQEMIFLASSAVGADTTSKVDATSANPGLKSQNSTSSKTDSDYVSRLKKEKAEVQQKLNDLINERDKLKGEYANATWYNKIGIGAKIGAILVQILFTAAWVERLTARIRENS